MVEFGLNLLSQTKAQNIQKMIGRRVDKNQDIDRNDRNDGNLRKISLNFIESLFLWTTICCVICICFLLFELIYIKFIKNR